MSGVTHTPGAWTVILRGEFGTFHIPQVAALEEATAALDNWAVASAAAGLIEAAPELLSALKAARWALAECARDRIEDWQRGTFPEAACVEQIDAVIAKAAGATHG